MEIILSITTIRQCVRGHVSIIKEGTYTSKNSPYRAMRYNKSLASWLFIRCVLSYFWQICTNKLAISVTTASVTIALVPDSAKVTHIGILQWVTDLPSVFFVTV